MSQKTFALTQIALALVLAPFLQGIINRVKALFAGRRGPPLLQLYFDLWKLLQKGAVYSRTTTWLFRAGPVIGLAAILLALAIAPQSGQPSLLSFTGDLLFFAALLGLARFMTVVAALDTGSAFEGMGASREVHFALFAEPALLVGLITLARQAGTLTLSDMYGHISMGSWAVHGTGLALLALAFLILLLAENSRMPVDDPNTHLELTMIHEVMAFDHGGPDLAFILYGAAVKLWVVGSLLAGIILPMRTGYAWMDAAFFLVAMGLVAVVIGIIESTMARLRLVRVPHLLAAAGTFSILALILTLRG